MASIAGASACAQQQTSARRSVGGASTSRGGGLVGVRWSSDDVTASRAALTVMSGQRPARWRSATTAAQPPLDKTQSLQTPSASPLVKDVPPELAAARQRERYRLLGGQRRVSSIERVRRCKTPIGNAHVGLVANEGAAHFTGVESCANIWACPVCAPKIRSARTTDVLEAIDRHTANGGGLVFLTLTLPHTAGDRLAPLVSLLSETWRYVTNSRAYKGGRKRFGYLGNIAALEVTHGGNGWHPHRHLMLFTDRQLSPDEVAAWEAQLHAVYNQRLTQQGWKQSKEHVGLRMDYVTDPSAAIGRYITKLQAGFELTRSDLKKSRTAVGRQPFDLLAAAMEDDESAARLWREYEQAMRRKSAVRFSPGLRDALDMGKEQTDDELAEQEVGGEAGIYIAARPFRRVTFAGRQGELLQAYANGGELAVLRLMQHWYPGEYVAVFDEPLQRLIIGG